MPTITSAGSGVAASIKDPSAHLEANQIFPPPMRSDKHVEGTTLEAGGEDSKADEDGIVSGKDGQKTTAEGRVIHYGKSQPSEKMKIEDGDAVGLLSRVLRRAPGSQSRLVSSAKGKPLAYRIFNAGDSLSSFLWIDQEAGTAELSGPLASEDEKNSENPNHPFGAGTQPGGDEPASEGEKAAAEGKNDGTLGASSSGPSQKDAQAEKKNEPNKK